MRATALRNALDQTQVQIFVWDYSNPCHTFPTLMGDLFVDTYFLVRLSLYKMRCLVLTP